MEIKDLIGWGASLILLATILQQIYSQWRNGSAEGVSMFLFGGQILASSAFVTYSVMVGDMVFIMTNAALLLSHFVGFGLTWRQKTSPPLSS